jgi:hypothetical protein
MKYGDFIVIWFWGLVCGLGLFRLLLMLGIAK